jgi:acetoin utilization deacetylase AcuC-like enzyme
MAPVRLYTHPACLQHDPGPGHPECPARLGAVIDALRAADLPGASWHDAPVATREQLLRAHSASHVGRILAEPGIPRRLDPDTAMSEHSVEAALRAAGAVCAAVDDVLAGLARRAFCAVRPPGHHATRDEAMGFCLFNAVAVGAAQAMAVHGLRRVAVIDFDVHHGNGTQDILWDTPGVLYVSSHQSPLYPGTGQPEERGGSGAVRNATLPPGANGLAFRELWEAELLPALERFRPQLLLVSAGFDAHRLDPLANLNLSAEDYAWLSARLVDCAERHAGGRLVSALEGGYSLSALRESSVAHVRALL